MATYQKTTRWTLSITSEPVDVTSDQPTPNESWRYTDRQGHEHHYARSGYPDLDFVVDERHWCDGTEWTHHDPHWVIDEAHYECRLCREIIEPRMDPPHTPKTIEGLRTATIEGPLKDGRRVEMILLGDEIEQLRAADDFDDAAERLAAAFPDRWMRWEVASR